MTLWAFIPPYYITFANERKQHLHRQSFICGDSGSNQTTLSQESRSRGRRREGLSQRGLRSIPKKPGGLSRPPRHKLLALSSASPEVFVSRRDGGR